MKIYIKAIFILLLLHLGFIDSHFLFILCTFPPSSSKLISFQLDKIFNLDLQHINYKRDRNLLSLPFYYLSYFFIQLNWVSCLFPHNKSHWSTFIMPLIFFLLLFHTIRMKFQSSSNDSDMTPICEFIWVNPFIFFYYSSLCFVT